jgi:hypothetical protein
MFLTIQTADRETDPNTLSVNQHNLGTLFAALYPRKARQSLAGKFAMPASIIWPVAASHRHLFRVHGLRALRLFPAVVLLLCAFGLAAAEAPSQLFLEKNSFSLSSAGFRVQVANDPAGQKALRALPAHRFVVNGVGEAVRYFYAEPQHCVCIFVGTQQAYDRYLGVTGIYARWHMFEEKREAVMAIEAAVLPLMA